MEEHVDQQSPRRRLGRGLSALLGGSSQAYEGNGDGAAMVQQGDEVAIDLIERNPFQPRQEFDAEPLKELAESIKLHGVLQPLIVRVHEDRYQLIAGERRLLAARQAGLEAVPCRVVDVDDRTVCEIAIDENLKRQDLNVLEKAQAFQDYIQRFECSIEEVAARLSLDRSTVSNMLRLLELPEQIKLAVRQNRITAGHARALLPLDEPRQHALCQRIEKESLSVRATEKAARELNQQAADGDVIPIEQAKSNSRPEKTNHVESLEQQLREQFGVKVEIKLRKADSGQVVLHFANNDEFERILQRIRRAA